MYDNILGNNERYGYVCERLKKKCISISKEFFFSHLPNAKIDVATLQLESVRISELEFFCVFLNNFTWLCGFYPRTLLKTPLPSHQ